MKDKQPFMSGERIWQQICFELPHDILFLKKGDCYCPDEHIKQVAVLTDGLMKVFIAEETGEERFMWMVEPYSLVQWNKNHNFAHSLIAIKNTKLYLVEKNLFLSKIRNSPELFEKYIDNIYQRYTYCVEKLLVTDTHNSQFKVYSFLLHLAYRYGVKQESGMMIIENILTRQDISSITGVHRTNIIKYISKLEQLEMIEKDRKEIRIKNLTALENLVKSLDINDK